MFFLRPLLSWRGPHIRMSQLTNIESHTMYQYQIELTIQHRQINASTLGTLPMAPIVFDEFSQLTATIAKATIPSYMLIYR